jgi:hypothetical protein
MFPLSQFATSDLDSNQNWPLIDTEIRRLFNPIIIALVTEDNPPEEAAEHSSIFLRLHLENTYSKFYEAICGESWNTNFN